MRGYDALVLVDVSRQGGEPGTLYVHRASSRDDVPAEIEDGETHRPARRWTRRRCCASCSAIGGWPGSVAVIACEPGDRRGRRPRADRRRSRRPSSARSRSCSRPSRELRTDAAYPAREGRHARALRRAAPIVDTAVRHAAGRRVTARAPCASGACARSSRPRSPSTSSSSRARPSARARGSSRSSSRRALRCEGCAHAWEIDVPDVPLPALRRRRTWRSLTGEELEVESIEVEEDSACTA